MKLKDDVRKESIVIIDEYHAFRENGKDLGIDIIKSTGKVVAASASIGDGHQQDILKDELAPNEVDIKAIKDVDAQNGPIKIVHEWFEHSGSVESKSGKNKLNQFIVNISRRIVTERVDKSVIVFVRDSDEAQALFKAFQKEKDDTVFVLDEQADRQKSITALYSAF